MSYIFLFPYLHYTICSLIDVPMACGEKSYIFLLCTVKCRYTKCIKSNSHYLHSNICLSIDVSMACCDLIVRANIVSVCLYGSVPFIRRDKSQLLTTCCLENANRKVDFEPLNQIDPTRITLQYAHSNIFPRSMFTIWRKQRRGVKNLFSLFGSY